MQTGFDAGAGMELYMDGAIGAHVAGGTVSQMTRKPGSPPISKPGLMLGLKPWLQMVLHKGWPAGRYTKSYTGCPPALQFGLHTGIHIYSHMELKAGSATGTAVPAPPEPFMGTEPFSHVWSDPFWLMGRTPFWPAEQHTSALAHPLQ